MAEFTADDYVSAFNKLKIETYHLRMLQANYNAPNRTLTATELAKAVGYEDYGAANLHYGRLGHQVGTLLGWEPLPKYKLEVLVDFKKPDQECQEWRWILKPKVAEAMERLGWVNRDIIECKYWLFQIMYDEIPDSWKLMVDAGVAAQQYAPGWTFEIRNVTRLKELKSGDRIIAAFKNHRFAGYGKLTSDFYRDGNSLEVHTNDGRVFEFKERFDCDWVVIPINNKHNFVDCSDLRDSIDTRLMRGLCVKPIDKESFNVIKSRLDEAGAIPMNKTKMPLYTLDQCAEDTSLARTDTGISNESEKVGSDVSYWIFQANPKHYDLDSELKETTDYELKNSNWTVNQYAQKIHPGDVAFLWTAGKNAGILAVSKISSRPYYNAEADGSFISDKKRGDGKQLWVDISIDYVLPERITRESLLKHPILESLQILRRPQGTNFPVTYEEAQALNDLIYNAVRPRYTLDQFSIDTGLDKETLERWAKAIERKGQAVLYGPPGTGKTFVAEHIARHLVSGGDGFVDLVQFHPAYAYEDFMQGIRPQAREDGTLEYSVIPGRFLNFCQRANKCQCTCVLIIDEINRANLARVFGELMYLLEYRDKEIPLAVDGTPFKIPRNVRIIGTMNTADRSIALVDHALRRRFAFIKLQPDYEILKKYHTENTSIPVDRLIQVLQDLNRSINDPHYELGISYFLKPDLKDHLEDIWKMEIEPYLDEYFFDNRKSADKFRWESIRPALGL